MLSSQFTGQTNREDSGSDAVNSHILEGESKLGKTQDCYPSDP